MSGQLLDLSLLFGHLSLLMFGGGPTILPEMQRQVTEVHGWLTPQEFAALFALAAFPWVLAGQPRADLIVTNGLVVTMNDRREIFEGGTVVVKDAHIVAVGPGEPSPATGETVPVDLTPGQRIIYSKYGGTETKVSGERLLILRDADVIALLP